MKNGIEDLRNHLFETIERLKDDDDAMDTDRAKAISETARVMVDSAKVECEYLRVTEQTQGSGFIRGETERAPELPKHNGQQH